jgi:hypothetical protein
MADEVRVGVVRFGASVSRRRRHLDVPRTHRVTVRLSDEEHQAVVANADAARMAVAAYLAEAGVAPLEPVTAGATGGERDERAALLIELMGAHRQVRGAATNLNQAVAKLHAMGEVPGELVAVVDYMRRVAGRVDEVVAAIAAQQPGRR